MTNNKSFNNVKKSNENLDSLRSQNIEIRVTLKKTICTLVPCAIFVISQHAYLYMECHNIEFLIFLPILILSGIFSLFCLIYCYALVMNGKGVELYQRDFTKVDEANTDWDRLRYMHKLGWESIYFGLVVVNSLYLISWCALGFGLFRLMPGMFGYLLSSIGASFISLGLCDYKYGDIA